MTEVIPFSELVSAPNPVFSAGGVRTAPAPAAPAAEEISFSEIQTQPTSESISPDDVAEVDTFYRRSGTELFQDDAFDPRAYFAQNPDVAKDPAQLQKLIDIYRSRRERGITAGALKEAVKSAPETGLKFAKGAWTLASNVFEFSGAQKLFNRAVGAVTGDNLQEESSKREKKALAEFEGGTELSATGIADLGRTGVRKFFGKSVKDLTDQELLAQLSEDASFQSQLAEVQQGRGEALKAAGLDADTLKKEGIELDPEAIENLSLVDPATVIATAGVFKVVGAAGKVLATAGTRAAAAKTASALNNVVNKTASTVVGKSLSGAGKVASVGARMAVKGVEAFPVLETLGATIGAGKGGVGGAIAGARAGASAQRALVKGVGVVGRAGENVTSFGQQLSGTLPRSAGLEKILGAVVPPVKGAVGGAVVGTAAAAPLAALTDDDVAAGGILGGGLILGASAGTALGTKAAIGEAVARRVFDPHGQSLPVVDSPGYGLDVALDATHSERLKLLSTEEQGAITTFREAVRGQGGEMYVVDGPTFKAKIAEEAVRRKGGELTPEELTAIDQASVSQGMFDGTIPGADGSARRAVFLNGDSKAVPHEAGHLFHSLLSASSQDGLRAAVREFYTPEQIADFQARYERRLGAKISPESAIDELVAENFSALFNNVPVTELTAPRGLLSRFGSVLAEGAEALGIDLTGGRKTPDLQAPVSHRLRNLFENAARGLSDAPKPPAAATPAPPTATAPAPTPTPRSPARNIRVTPEQQGDFAAKRAAETGIPEARELAKDDPTTLQRVNEVSASMEAGNPVLEIEHLGIKSTGSAAAPEGRTPRRGTQSGGYAELERLRIENRANAPEAIVNLHQKTFAPVRWTNQGGTPTLVAMSLDKVISNIHQIAREAANKNASKLIPYASENGKLTEASWRDAVSDAQKYAENQSNGFRGDGQRLTRPTEDVGLSIPAENPSYAPQLLSPERADFQNLIQGLATPETAREVKGATPGNIKGQIVAEANKRVTLTPADITPKNAGKQEFKSFPGRTLREVNPLRNALVERGVPVRELIEVTERIRAKDIASIKPRPDINFKAPVTDIIRGGFLPAEGESVREYGQRILAASPDEWKRITQEGGGLTDDAYRLGFSLRDRESLGTLRALQEEASQAGKTAMLAGDFDAAYPAVTKAQYFREAYEAATDTGSAANPTGGWRRTFPNSRPPFPGAPETGGMFLPPEGQTKPTPSKEIQDLASSYAEKIGLPYKPASSYSPVNQELSRRLADFYESAAHSPHDPEVKASYKALADETLGQLDAIQSAGYVLELFPDEGEPYASSAKAIADIRDNKHLFVLNTGGNFGGSPDNPLLAESGVPGLPTVNDVFRGVHDFFGHGKEGYQFGPRGEFNAWRAHSEMYSPAAQGALAAETLAQNSWVNFGKHLEGKNIPAKERPFAEQKAVVVPKVLIDEARGAATEGPAFLARTEAGRELEQDGFTIKPSGRPGRREVEIFDADNFPVGRIASAKRRNDQTEVTFVKVNKDFRGEGIGEVLYRELADQLKEDGVKTVVGSVVSPEPLAIRRKVFGGFKEIKLNGKPASFEEAIKTAGRVADLEEIASIEPTNEITPESQFLPKAAATAKSPTGWILPNKTFVPLETAYHEQYLATHAPFLNKKFGTKFSSKPDVEERLAALNRGFVRIRHDAAKAGLHVEANSEAWGRVKSAVANHLADHESQIDSLTVSLLNDRGLVVDSVREGGLSDLDGSEKMGKMAEAVDSLRVPKR